MLLHKTAPEVRWLKMPVINVIDKETEPKQAL